MSRPRLVIIGAGGHGGCVADIAQLGGWHVAGYLDTQRNPGECVGGHPILGGDRLLDDRDFVNQHAFALGIGDPEVRSAYGKKLITRGALVPAIINPNSLVSPHAEIGQGVVMLGFNAVNHQAIIQNFVVLDWNATVGHHSVVGEGVFLGPGVQITGHCRLGPHVYFGVGSRTVPKIEVGAGSIVGAGATVTKSLPEYV
ncbi:MAG: hypothetical protein AAF449_07845, partial [Myxococcota bacterium]